MRLSSKQYWGRFINVSLPRTVFGMFICTNIAGCLSTDLKYSWFTSCVSSEGTDRDHSLIIFCSIQCHQFISVFTMCKLCVPWNISWYILASFPNIFEKFSSIYSKPFLTASSVPACHYVSQKIILVTNKTFSVFQVRSVQIWRATSVNRFSFKKPVSIIHQCHICTFSIRKKDKENMMANLKLR